jgi:predicted amino acid racemase
MERWIESGLFDLRSQNNAVLLSRRQRWREIQFKSVNNNNCTSIYLLKKNQATAVRKLRGGVWVG